VSDDERIFRASFVENAGFACLLYTPFMAASLAYLLRSEDSSFLFYFFAPLVLLIPVLRRVTAVRVSREGIRNRYGGLVAWPTVRRLTVWNWLGVLVVRGNRLAVALPSIGMRNDFRECLRSRLTPESPVTRSPADMSKLGEQHSFVSSVADSIWAAGCMVLVMWLAIAAGLGSVYAVYGRVSPNIGAFTIPLFIAMATVWTNRKVLISEHGIAHSSGVGMSWSEVTKARPAHFPFRGMLVTDRSRRMTVPRSIVTDPKFRETLRSLAGEQNPLVLALE